MFGFHIVGSFLPGLFEALFSLFDPEKKTHNNHQSSYRDTHSHLWNSLFHPVKKQNFQLGLSRRWLCGIWTQWSQFVKAPVLLLRNDSLWFTTAWREPAVSLHMWALKRQLISMLALTIYFYRHASTHCVIIVRVSAVCRHVHTAQVMINISSSIESKRKTSRERIGMIADGKGRRVNAFKFVFILSYWTSKARGMFLLWQMHITIQSSFGIMDQFAFCWHNTTVSLYSSNHWKLHVFFSLLGWRQRFGSFNLFSLHEFEWIR